TCTRVQCRPCPRLGKFRSPRSLRPSACRFFVSRGRELACTFPRKSRCLFSPLRSLGPKNHEDHSSSLHDTAALVTSLHFVCTARRREPSLGRRNSENFS